MLEVFVNIYKNLPAPFQDSNNQMCVLACLATGYFYRSLPPLFKTQLLRQWAILCVGMEYSLCTGPKNAIVWSLGMGGLCAVFSMIFYDLIWAQVEIFIRKYTPSRKIIPDEPVEPGPEFQNQPSNQK